MRSSYRLLCPPRIRQMPVAAAAPIVLLAGRPVAAAPGLVPGGTALAAASGLASGEAAAAPPRLSTSQLLVNGVPFAIRVS
jgi:hypothetical protein